MAYPGMACLCKAAGVSQAVPPQAAKTMFQTLKTRIVQKFLLFLLLPGFSLFFQASVKAADYHIGPGQPYTELGDVPWISLQAGDRVFIHWRSTPYAAKIFLRAQGSPDNPVLISGIPDSDGNLPVITGENATTDEQFVGYFNSTWTEDLGLFLIYRGPDDDYYNYTPSNIIFENLELTGVKPENTFTDQFGNTRNYNTFSSAIHALIVHGLTVRHCKIHDNAQGIFTNSYGGGMAQMSTNLLIEYNEIWDNGNLDSGHEHNIYAQSLGTTIQYNRIGRLKAGSWGASIKDRSSGTLIRYNWIEASARTLDLVEAEDGWEITTAQPDYHDIYVYGNVFTNYLDIEPYGIGNIHYGYDNSPDLGKEGTLYFFNNTVYFETDQDVFWYVYLFDLSSNTCSVAMYNNIVHALPTSTATTPSELRLMASYGSLYLYANNWLQQDYLDTYPGSEAQIHVLEQPLVGIAPGFMDATAEDFTLQSNSNCIDAAGPLPPELEQNHPLDYQYLKHASAISREALGAAMDLGAFEYSGPVHSSFTYVTSVPSMLYPNPAHTTLYINSDKGAIKACQVFDLRGRRIPMELIARNRAIQIAALKPGMYFLQVEFASGEKQLLKFQKY